MAGLASPAFHEISGGSRWGEAVVIEAHESVAWSSRRAACRKNGLCDKMRQGLCRKVA